MNPIFSDIPDNNRWRHATHIEKGWSGDDKYCIETLSGDYLLLKVSDINELERKKNEFRCLENMASLKIFMTRPIDFGVFNFGKSVYMLMTWIEGEDAQLVLPTLSEKEQYDLGITAGYSLKKIHSITAPSDQEKWTERFNRKIDNRISSYLACGITFPCDHKMISYVNNNRKLLLDRPQTFQHGDYHVGNMIITPEGELGIIDFNRLDYGDPWEEFNRITFTVDTSPIFAVGLINGYFDNDVPELFFKTLALYVSNNVLSSIPWSIPFGETDVQTMLKLANDVMNWYDNFETFIPDWYKSEYNTITNQEV